MIRKSIEMRRSITLGKKYFINIIQIPHRNFGHWIISLKLCEMVVRLWICTIAFSGFYVLTLHIEIIIWVLLVVVIVGIGLVQNSSRTRAWMEQSGFPSNKKETLFLAEQTNKTYENKKQLKIWLLWKSFSLLFAEDKRKCKFLLGFTLCVG